MRLRAKFNGGTGAQESSRSKKSVGLRDENPAESAPSPAARNLALAHHIERLIERELVADYTQTARMLGVSQARMTHLMGLLLLAPAIQEAILMGEIAPKDKELRELARIADWAAQESEIGITGHGVPICP